MSSRSSPKDVAALPSGSRVFIDANIFIYHFTHTSLTAACTKFLQRVEVGDIEGITSVITLAEVSDPDASTCASCGCQETKRKSRARATALTLQGRNRDNSCLQRYCRSHYLDPSPDRPRLLWNLRASYQRLFNCGGDAVPSSYRPGLQRSGFLSRTCIDRLATTVLSGDMES